MKLVYGKLSEPIRLKCKGLTIIGTNNSNVYTDLILGLQERKETLELMDEEWHTVPINKVIDYEGNVIDNETLFSKYKKYIINQISSSLSDNQKQKILLMQSKIQDFTENILDDESQLINISNLCDIKKVFSAKNIDFPALKSTIPYDIIEDDIKIHAKYFPQKILAVSNLSHYLSKDELLKILKQAQKNNVSFLDIDFFELDKFNYYLKCDCYIDNDFEVWKQSTLN